MKKILVVSLFVISMAAFVGCAASDNDDILKDIEVVDSDKNEQADVKRQEDSATETDINADDSFMTFEDLSKSFFEFCSGAGGWATELTIEKDGSFSFDYHDSDMGDIGEGYPNGTLYSSIGSGHFADLKKIDDLTYEMRLVDIIYENEVGTEEIADEVLYKYVSAYGLDGCEKFEILLPGTKISSLSDDLRMWIFSTGEDDAVLDFPVIVNTTDNYAFNSSKRLTPKEEAEMELNTYLEFEKNFQSSYEQASTLEEKCQIAFNYFDSSDYLLNDIWSKVKYSNTETDFQKYLDEQRTWLKERDARFCLADFDEISQEYYDYYNGMADYNMRRCEKIITYIGE